MPEQCPKPNEPLGQPITMHRVSESSKAPVVTVLSDRAAFEPKLREDAACVASASTAALRPDRLLVAFLALLLLWLVGLIWDAQNETRIPPAAGAQGHVHMRELLRGLPEEKRPEGWELQTIDGRVVREVFADQSAEQRALVEHHRSRGSFEYLVGSMKDGASASFEGLIALEPEVVWRGLVAGSIEPIGRLWAEDRGFLVTYGVWFLLVLSLLGGAMCRSDAERLGNEREISLMSSLRWAVGDWRRLWGAVMLPPFMAVLLLAPIALVLMLLSLIPVVDVIVAILWILPLVLGFAAAIVLAAWLVGLPLIIPAAAVESGDPGEITVRVVTLLRRRPLRALLLSATALVTGLLMWMVITMVVVFTVTGTSSALSAIVDPIGPIARPSWPSLKMQAPIPQPPASEPQASGSPAAEPQASEPQASGAPASGSPASGSPASGSPVSESKLPEPMASKSAVPSEAASKEASNQWGATSRLSTTIIEWWNGVVILVARAWILGFILLAAGRIYLCLRRTVEKLPFDDLGQTGPQG